MIHAYTDIHFLPGPDVLMVGGDSSGSQLDWFTPLPGSYSHF